MVSSDDEADEAHSDDEADEPAAGEKNYDADAEGFGASGQTQVGS